MLETTTNPPGRKLGPTHAEREYTYEELQAMVDEIVAQLSAT
jgi:hypothetical protein